jgi:phenylacetate-CoA ligase
MDLLAPLIRRIVAPAWAAWEGTAYLRQHQKLVRTQFDDPAEIEGRQWAAMKCILEHAFSTTEFWRERLIRRGLVPSDIRSPADLPNLGLLTKHDLRNSGSKLRSSEPGRGPIGRRKTSGSTGTSVEVWVDEAANQWKRACTLRSDEWTGWRLGEKTAKVWGNPEYLKNGWRGRLRNSLLERARYLDTLKMEGSTIDRFLDEMHRWQPVLLFGHAHSLFLVAEVAAGRGGARFRPRGILSTAMVLHDWERRRIEDVFGCPVTNRYGCEEVSLIACQCERHEGLHVNADGVYVEIIRPDGTPAEAGEAGSVVVTDLANRAMPMIRYQVGDMASWSSHPCSCGRGLPALSRIEGRSADYVVTPDGKLVSGISLTENFAVLVPGIEQLQIVQPAPDRLVFRIVPGLEFGPQSEAQIERLVAERFGGGVQHAIERVERILPEPSGKYRFCISHVPNPFMTMAGAAP